MCSYNPLGVVLLVALFVGLPMYGMDFLHAIRLLRYLLRSKSCGIIFLFVRSRQIDGAFHGLTRNSTGIVIIQFSARLR